jgi:hypothetical protein
MIHRMTPWFQAKVKPVHHGLYQVKALVRPYKAPHYFGASIYWCYWSGYWGTYTKHKVLSEGPYFAFDGDEKDQILMWRGIMND